MSIGTIKKVAGPLVIASGMRDANMFDVVRVSNQRLIGEIIEMHGDEASVQVYEETSGLGPGEPVESMNVPMSVELGPGLISSIYDGIQRPLDDIMKLSGNNLKRGVEVPSLKRDLKWNFVPVAKVGDQVEPGDVLGTVQETASVVQKIMVPVGTAGTVKEIKAGEFTVEEVVAVVATEDGDKELTMMQRWPVRKGRPYQEKLPPEMPLITGQRVVDGLFPIAKGGVAAVPGPFGSGKTVIQHQLAKWAEAD
ncbi:MAG: V-type ATP synthase subunit A, partial [Lachnospiraceae bacterium]|nr:V-type ATP synthase subunit A [Lachnospiraceae bacterium]